MKKLLGCFVLASALMTATGCDSVNYLMTYTSPTGSTAEELDAKFQKLSHADNVFDGAVVVRGEIDDEHDFDEKSKVYDFDSGASVFKTYALPLNATNLNIRIESKIGTSMFAPSVALLNKQKQLVKIFGFSSFQYRPFEDFVDDNVFFKFSLNNFSAGDNAIAYMVIYTTDADLTTQTTITHPAKLYAIAHKTAVPTIDDPKIPHARLGHINVTINLETTTGDALSEIWESLKGPLWGGSDRTVISDIDDGAVNAGQGTTANIKTSDGRNVMVVNPDKDTGVKTVKSSNAAAEVLGGTVAPTSAKGTMMKETEEMYNNMIKSAVKAGDISKAMKLAAEATNAGSATANGTLNSALQSRK